MPEPPAALRGHDGRGLSFQLDNTADERCGDMTAA